jgi:hypothetical protein
MTRHEVEDTIQQRTKSRRALSPKAMAARWSREDGGVPGIRLSSDPRSSNHGFSLSMAELGEVPETPGSSILEPLACAVVSKDARHLSPLESTALEW